MECHFRRNLVPIMSLLLWFIYWVWFDSLQSWTHAYTISFCLEETQPLLDSPIRRLPCPDPASLIFFPLLRVEIWGERKFDVLWWLTVEKPERRHRGIQWFHFICDSGFKRYGSLLCLNFCAIMLRLDSWSLFPPAWVSGLRSWCSVVVSSGRKLGRPCSIWNYFGSLIWFVNDFIWQQWLQNVYWAYMIVLYDHFVYPQGLCRCFWSFSLERLTWPLRNALCGKWWPER